MSKTEHSNGWIETTLTKILQANFSFPNKLISKVSGISDVAIAFDPFFPHFQGKRLSRHWTYFRLTVCLEVRQFNNHSWLASLWQNSEWNQCWMTRELTPSWQQKSSGRDGDSMCSFRPCTANCVEAHCLWLAVIPAAF